MSYYCFKLGWTDGNKRFTEYRSEVIAVASQAVMDDRIMVSFPVRILQQGTLPWYLTKCPNMFSGRVEACPCPGFKNKFPQSVFRAHAVSTTLMVSGKKKFLM